jgi:ATP-dependent Lon protease
MTDNGSALPVLPLKNTVVFPELVVPLAVGRPKSLGAVKAASDSNSQMLTVAQRDAEQDAPDRDGIHDIGTLVSIKRVERRDGGANVIVQGIQRVRVLTQESNDPHLVVNYRPLPNLVVSEHDPDAPRIDALVRENLDLARTLAQMFDAENGLQVFHQLIGSITDPVVQMYRITSLVPNIDIEKEQEVLSAATTLALMEKVHELLLHEKNVNEVRREIAESAKHDIDKQQREHLLRQQKRAIEQALGEEGGSEETAELREQLAKANLPEAVQKEVDRELKRLGRMSENAADYQVARSYLELIAELPWNTRTEDALDLKHAQEVLDEDHYGLEDVKDRILESLAVMQLNPDSKAPIILLVGPPGVGKTSLGQSIARAMGRKFERLSLGGLHDEAELRGHRRTYIGAMPGRLIQAVRRAGVSNPLLMLDEIDKLGRDFRGDPAAALMEILDPAQNKEFRDNYLNLPFDLSKVFFITTANTLEGIPRPLLDRMEVMELTGYSDREKREIARRYLIPRQRAETGLEEGQLDIPDDVLGVIIRRYTREAGVRELERVIGRLARKRARQVLERVNGDALAPITADRLTTLIGPLRFQSDKGRESLPAGVAAGLAWTEAGGDVLYIEAILTHRDERVMLTGQLGNVMQESAKAARSYIWSAADKLGIDRKRIEKRGVHIHVPAGAVPKDGPSAGITMATALVSAYSEQPIRPHLAMTGEITLSGLVLPVGGIKEKVLAAHRAGMTHLILPKDNEADLDKLPDSVRKELVITLVERLEEVIDVAIPGLRKPERSSRDEKREEKDDKRDDKKATKAVA